VPITPSNLTDDPAVLKRIIAPMAQGAPDFKPKEADLNASGLVRNRLAAGGKRIRTTGPAKVATAALAA
jgi:hypothetical protein